jgi:hypothetical protein
VTGDRVVADDLGGLITQGNELPDGRSAHRGVDELTLCFDLPGRMAIAELIRAKNLELRSILGKHGFPEGFDGLRNGSLIACLSSDLRAETQDDRAERARACHYQMTASDRHVSLL